MSKVLIIGAGRQARAIAYILSKQDCVTEISCYDQSAEALHKIAEEISKNKLSKEFYEDEIFSIECINTNELEDIVSKYDLVVSSLDYSINEALTKICIKQKTHMVDLGGNNDIVRDQLKHNNDAVKAGVTIIPDCGLAPGMANLLAAHGINQLNGADEVKIRVGGLPINPQPPLNYQLVFNIQGLTNEYLNSCKAVRDGKTLELLPLEDLEYLELQFDSAMKKNNRGFIDVEAFNTSGGLSTLIESFGDSVKNMDYKTIRYLGHCNKIKLLNDLGFFVGPDNITEDSPREFSERILKAAPSLNKNDADLVLVRVYIKNKDKQLEYQITDYYNEQTGHTAMMRGTGYPTAVIASMILDGTISSRGVLPGEKCVPLDEFIERVEETGIVIGRDKN